MPLPKPNQDESRTDFMTRCINSPIMKKEYPNRQQRVAICSVQYRYK